jgi:hypothetical protein
VLWNARPKTCESIPDVYGPKDYKGSLSEGESKNKKKA